MNPDQNQPQYPIQTPASPGAQAYPQPGMVSPLNVNTAAIIRMSTPKYPVMDDAFIDFYYFYCPNRILWDNFKQFMGEVEETPWMPTKEYKVPQIKIEGNKNHNLPAESSILDYMGVPTKIGAPFSINALPIRAYVMIWNEFFRDQNVENQAVLLKDDRDTTYQDSNDNENIEAVLKEAYTGGRCLPVNKFHDYFTSCLPYPQRGPAVTLPIEGNAPVNAYSSYPLTKENETNLIIRGFSPDGNSTRPNNLNMMVSSKDMSPVQMQYIVTGKQIGRAHG